MKMISITLNPQTHCIAVNLTQGKTVSEFVSDSTVIEEQGRRG